MPIIDWLITFIVETIILFWWSLSREMSRIDVDKLLSLKSYNLIIVGGMFFYP
jgi:hypothetical protein